MADLSGLAAAKPGMQLISAPRNGPDVRPEYGAVFAASVIAVHQVLARVGEGVRLVNADHFTQTRPTSAGTCS